MGLRIMYLPKGESTSDIESECAKSKQDTPRVLKVPGVTPLLLVADRHTLPWSAMVLDPEDEDWQHLNRTNWRGLGLADPIKNVEVRSFQISPRRALSQPV